MNANRPNDVRPPRPELLAAYLDGELDPTTRGDVESWLAAHPDAAAEVEGQRRVLRLYQDAAPPDPTESRWVAVLAHVEAAVHAVPRRWPGRGWRAVVWAAAAVTAAALAAVAGTWVLRQPPAPTSLPALSVSEVEGGSLLVVSTDDVDIISMDGDDEETLVIGEPPVRGPIVLATNSDIALAPIDPNQDGMEGVQVANGATGPMLVVRPDTAVPGRED